MIHTSALAEVNQALNVWSLNTLVSFCRQSFYFNNIDHFDLVHITSIFIFPQESVTGSISEPSVDNIYICEILSVDGSDIHQ